MGGCLRILIVGGGVAGLTLAALLRQRGGEPTVVEAVPEYGRAGYLISLWPMGNRVLRGLGLYEGFREMGVPLLRHVLRDGRGRIIRVSEVGARMAPHGEIRTLERADLVDLLRSHNGVPGGIPVRMGTTVGRIEQDERSVRVAFSDGSEGEFDLVVGADGANSRVRNLLFGEVSPRPAGAVLYWWWEEAEPGAEPATTIDDYWGAGRLLGLYSGRNRSARYAMFPADTAEDAREAPPVAGGGSSDGAADGPTAARRALLRERLAGFGGPETEKILARLQGAGRVDRLELSDLRSPAWHKGRVALLGDSAVSVLPVAGVGASLAMESAAALADELLRADPAHVPGALRLYEARRRKRAEKLQGGSRMMIRLPLVRRPGLAAARDALLRRLPERVVAGDAGQMMDRPV